MCADFSYSSLRSELFSALHARHLTGDRNDAQRHFLAFVFFFKDSVKKDGLFSFWENVLNFWKVKTCFVNKHKCAHTGNGRELWALLSMHKVQWLLSGTERKSLKHKTGTETPPKKIGIAGLVWKDRSLLFFILLCSDLIREKRTRARRHRPCVSLLTLEKVILLCVDTGTRART